jgi:glycosyltransferase involved in cell wall biosynthesis
MNKILHLGKYVETNHGGIERATFFIIKNVNKYTHHLICFNEDRKLKKNKTILRPFITLLSQPLSFEYIIHAFFKSKKTDIVHIHSPNVVAFIAALFISKPIIIHWHADIISKGIVYSFYKVIEYLVLRKSKLIIVGTKNYASNSKPLKKFTNKIKIIPYISEYKKVKNIRSLTNKYSYLKNKNIFLSVGRLVEYKNFDQIIELAKYSKKNDIFLIIGSGPLKVRLYEKIKKNKLEEKIKIITNSEDNELFYFYKKANALLFLSNDRRESFGIVLVEAMRNDLLIFANKNETSGIKDIIKNNVNGIYLHNDDPKKNFELITNVLLNKHLVSHIKNNNKVALKDRYDKRKVMMKYSEIYKKLN